MYRIYADGNLIYQPASEFLLISPKMIKEVGKAGSVEFTMPPNHPYYGTMERIKTAIRVEQDGNEVFYGRLLSNERDFNNLRKMYCEGALAYLIDSVQSGRRFEGKAHDLFRLIITEHNSRVEQSKQFTVGEITIPNKDVVVIGPTDDENQNEEDIPYDQIAINANTSEWKSTLDFIESYLIDYLGGYLKVRRVGSVNYIDYLSDLSEEAEQEIVFGENLLDLTEKVASEDIFTVLIPLGDENLTIASVNDGSDELADEELVEQYGRIVKSHLFSGVNKAQTLLEDATQYMETKKKSPVTIEIKAIDLHLVNPEIPPFDVGMNVHVRSVPHGIDQDFMCTKIEYDLVNPDQTVFTFGTPDTSLTEQYRKDKQKSGKGGSDTQKAAPEETLNKFFDAWINIEKEAGHTDMGAIYRELQDEKEVLSQQVGIDFDAVSGNVNIKDLKREHDTLNGTVIEQGSTINLLNGEMNTQIQLSSSRYSELKTDINETDTELSEFKMVEQGHYATLTILASDLESLIEMKADRVLVDAKIAQINGDVVNIQSDVDRIGDDLSAEVNISAARHSDLKSQEEGHYATILARATDLESMIGLKADRIEVDSRLIELGAKTDRTIDSISVMDGNLKEVEFAVDQNTDSITMINSDILQVNGRLMTAEAAIEQLWAKKVTASEIEAALALVDTFTVNTDAVFYGNAEYFGDQTSESNLITVGAVDTRIEAALDEFAETLDITSYAKKTDITSTIWPTFAVEELSADSLYGSSISVGDDERDVETGLMYVTGFGTPTYPTTGDYDVSIPFFKGNSSSAAAGDSINFSIANTEKYKHNAYNGYSVGIGSFYYNEDEGSWDTTIPISISAVDGSYLVHTTLGRDITTQCGTVWNRGGSTAECLISPSTVLDEHATVKSRYTNMSGSKIDTTSQTITLTDDDTNHIVKAMVGSTVIAQKAYESGSGYDQGWADAIAAVEVYDYYKDYIIIRIPTTPGASTYKNLAYVRPVYYGSWAIQRYTPDSTHNRISVNIGMSYSTGSGYTVSKSYSTISHDFLI